MDQHLDQQANARREQARRIRVAAADLASDRPLRKHQSNGDEERLKFDGKLSFLGNTTKSLPHHSDGRVFPAAYQALLHALKTGAPEDFERIPLGPRSVDLFDADLETLLAAPVEPYAVLEAANGRPPQKLLNPTAALAFDLEGPDTFTTPIPPAPSVLSSEAAAELAELYAMALLRDVWFTDFETNEHAVKATKAFNLFTDHPVREHRAQDTPTTLFRGALPGDDVGPYISQFLLLGTPTFDGKRSPQEGIVDYGSSAMDQRIRPGKAGLDYVTSWEEWLDIQNGANLVGADQYEDERRFITTPRDLVTYVHDDLGYPAFVNAALILLGMQAPPSPSLPFNTSRTQDGFITFGPVHLSVLLPEVLNRALKHSWFGKWYVHRRLRPEAMGALAHQQSTGIAHGLDQRLIDSSLLADVAAKYGSRLLPQAFPEGSPTHPSYGGGHAAFSGACATILKAFFDETHEIPAFVPDQSTGGKSLKPYTTPDGTQVMLTVGGEINKLASNLSIGRHMAGVHYFSDYFHPGVLLGEEVAIAFLQEQKLTYHEPVRFTLTRFDGTKITI